MAWPQIWGPAAQRHTNIHPCVEGLHLARVHGDPSSSRALGCSHSPASGRALRTSSGFHNNSSFSAGGVHEDQSSARVCPACFPLGDLCSFPIPEFLPPAPLSQPRSPRGHLVTLGQWSSSAHPRSLSCEHAGPRQGNCGALSHPEPW